MSKCLIPYLFTTPFQSHPTVSLCPQHQTIYGLFGTHDPVLWIPNMIGFALGCSQILLVVIYGKKSESSNDHVSLELKTSLDCVEEDHKI